ncbi:MAG: ATP-binding protein [Planctomycetota bacterium]|nr:ATP-binding protein [Planctomycetota bacterium]
MSLSRSIWLLSATATAVVGTGLIIDVSLRSTLNPTVSALAPSVQFLIGLCAIAFALGILASQTSTLGRATRLGAIFVVGLAAVLSMSGQPFLMPGALIALATLLSVHWRNRIGEWTSAVLASMLIGVGLLALLHLEESPLEDVLSEAINNIPRTLGLLACLAGASVLARTYQESRRGRAGTEWLPAATFIVLTSGAVSLTLNLVAYEDKLILEQASSRENRFAMLMRYEWEMTSKAAQRFVARIESSDSIALALHRRDLLQHFADLEGLHAVSAVNPDCDLIWTDGASSESVPWDENVESALQSVLRDASITGSLRTLDHVTLRNGCRGILIVAPLDFSPFDSTDAYIIFTIDVGEFAHADEMWFERGFRTEVLLNGEMAYSFPNDPVGLVETSNPGTTVAFAGGLWTVRATPTQDWIDERRSIVPPLVLTASLLIAALASMSIGFAQHAIRRAERAEFHQRRTDALVDAAPMVPIIATDHNGLITLFNGAAQLLSGVAARDVVGSRTLASLLHSDELESLAAQRPDAAAAHAMIAEISRSRNAGAMREWRVRRSDGSVRVVTFAATNWAGERGNAHGHLIIGVDVTDGVAARQELVSAREQAEAANRAKSELLSTVSHEIRTPMTAILGFADMLDDPALSDAERTDFARTIRSNGEHLVKVVNDILDLQRIESGYMAIESIETVPAEVVRDVVSLMRVHAAKKGVELTLSVNGDVSAVCLTDPGRLRQIVTNLIGNAIKFTPQGSVQVALDCISRRGSVQCRLQVEDHGIGMTQETLSRVFIPFGQADPSIARRFGGSGLGLAISRRLATLLGGTLTATSTYGSGSTFALAFSAPLIGDARSIPAVGSGTYGAATAEVLPPPPATDEPDAALAGLRILLVEDSPDTRRLLKAILQRAGAYFEEAIDGVDGVERESTSRIAGHPFDIILMDLDMPRMDGRSAAAEIRKNGGRSRIIALTGHGTTHPTDPTTNAVFDEDVIKPISRQRLIAICQAVLTGRRATQPTPKSR